MIYRGDVLAATVDVTAGTDTPYTCTDDNAVYGETVYRAVAHNAGGDGLESRVTVFIGNDRPSVAGMVRRPGRWRQWHHLRLHRM